jgi:predicted amidophosphoribosyltransferase
MPRTCLECGAPLRVRRGLCRRCRRRAMGKGTTLPGSESRPPRPPDLEPPHSRPWVHRGGG